MSKFEREFRTFGVDEQLFQQDEVVIVKQANETCQRVAFSSPTAKPKLSWHDTTNRIQQLVIVRRVHSQHTQLTAVATS